MRKRFKCPYCDASYPIVMRRRNGRFKAGFRALYDHVIYTHEEDTNGMGFSEDWHADDVANKVLGDVWHTGSNQGFWTPPNRR